MNRQPERLPTSNERPTVLIAGSGFGGFHAARELERRLPAEAADIVLASPENHLTYGPLLPNVAAGVIEPRHVAVALHGELRRTRYLTGALTALDIPGRTATLSDDDGKVASVHWDRLVLAPGAVTRLPVIPGLAEHALGLKTMTAAIALHDHVIRQLPILSNIPAPSFLKALSLAEMALGTALLAPVVPPALAGAALTGFAGSLVTMYLRTPTLHRPNSIWPTPEGVGQSKDGWMLGVGLSLLSQGLGIDKFGKLRGRMNLRVR